MVVKVVFGIIAALTVLAEEFPRGQIIEEVKCGADSAQSYALYIPSDYTPGSAWGVIFGFDPRARGRTPVERFQAAAEKYGYIVAGSNNSRNGSWPNSMAAAAAMARDVATRFSLDPKRVYTAGMSGGARVAMGVALGNNVIAGVIAASAGFPDGRPAKKAPFAVFGTAGSEDFNYIEMRDVDRNLTTPHRLAIFEGGHVWLSAELAMEAIEWMELRAVRDGKSARDVGEIFDKRVAAAEKLKGRLLLEALEGIVEDFQTLRDVKALEARVAALKKDKHVRDEVAALKKEEDNERRMLDQFLSLERELATAEVKSQILGQLRELWKKQHAVATGSENTANRRVARRVMRGLASGVMERGKDKDYVKIVEEFRLPRV